MEITIKKIATQHLDDDPRSSDITNTYLVVQDAREFRIACRTHAHGSSLTLAGQEGTLYTDRDENSVHRQVIAVGKICGISIESDEVVGGLSPWALRGVALAERRKEAREIRLAFGGPGEPCRHPVILVDNEPAGPES